MAKGAKGAPPMKEMSSPAKAGGGTMQKYSPSPTQKKKDEHNKPKSVNLMHPNGTCLDIRGSTVEVGSRTTMRRRRRRVR